MCVCVVCIGVCVRVCVCVCVCVGVWVCVGVCVCVSTRMCGMCIAVVWVFSIQFKDPTVNICTPVYLHLHDCLYNAFATPMALSTHQFKLLFQSAA